MMTVNYDSWQSLWGHMLVGYRTFYWQEKFASAMLKGTSPTLLCKGFDFVDIRNNPLPEIFPVQFPFGTGDVHDNRKSVCRSRA